MKKIENSDDIISEFKGLGNGIKKITKEITKEDLVEDKRERGSKKYKIDIIGITPNFKVGYEVWYKIPSVQNILQKLNDRREDRKEITHWALIIPYKNALKIGNDLGAEKIYVVSWDTCNNTKQIDFSVLWAFCSHLKK